MPRGRRSALTGIDPPDRPLRRPYQGLPSGSFGGAGRERSLLAPLAGSSAERRLLLFLADELADGADDDGDESAGWDERWLGLGLRMRACAACAAAQQRETCYDGEGNASLLLPTAVESEGSALKLVSRTYVRGTLHCYCATKDCQTLSLSMPVRANQKERERESRCFTLSASIPNDCRTDSSQARPVNLPPPLHHLVAREPSSSLSLSRQKRINRNIPVKKQRELHHRQPDFNCSLKQLG